MTTEDRILDHLVAMARSGPAWKVYAWSAAKAYQKLGERVHSNPPFATLPDRLVERMKQESTDGSNPDQAGQRRPGSR